MKRFVVSILFASVFFLGIGSIVESVGARFKSDQKALEIIARSRTAIGGDANLREVRSMTIVGSTTNFFEKNGVPTTELGGTEINFELPGRFSKSVKIGDPNGSEAAAGIHRKVEVVVVEKDGSGADLTSVESGEGKDVFVIRKGDGNVEWKSDSDVELKAEGNMIILKKEDGSIVELPADKTHKMRIHKGEGDGSAVWNTEDGKKIIVKTDSAHFTPRHAGSGGEMLRTVMSLLMTAPEGVDVSYKFAGEGDVDGYPCNIIEVASHGSSFKLFIDAASDLPRMISYAGHGAVFFHKSDSGDMTKEALIEMKKEMAQPVERQVRFSDFRSVDGLLLPHRWTESVAGKQSQIFDVTTYEINPSNIAEKFANEKVIVRKMKPQDN